MTSPLPNSKNNTKLPSTSYAIFSPIAEAKLFYGYQRLRPKRAGTVANQNFGERILNLAESNSGTVRKASLIAKDNKPVRLLKPIIHHDETDYGTREKLARTLRS